MSKKTLLEAFMAIGVLGGAVSLLTPSDAFAQSSATVGSLRGVLKDKATGEPAIGATVVATSPALVGEQVVITDETGQYFINSLPPGTYTLTIYYNNKPFSRAGVLIQLGKEAVVNVTVDSSTPANAAGPGEVIEIKGTVPIIDQGSTKTGVTITDDYTRNIPTGRTFAGVLGSTAGSQGDLYGVSLAGATSAENVYVVEGINTTDTGFGGVSSNLPNEFISETEIITGGYNAEFGRATGGIVNVVTKSGSNQFRGSVFGYLTPGGLVADAETIAREGSSIDTETNLNYQYDVGAELGGPIIKDKLWFHVGLNPSSTKSTLTRIVNRNIDADQNGIPDVDETTGFLQQEQVNSTDFTQQLSTYFFTAKINGAINQNNQFQISAFGNPRSGDPLTANQVKNPDFNKFHLEDGAYDFAGKWTSKFNDGKTQLDAVIGFHRGFERQSPTSSAQDLAFVRYGFERSLFDFESIEPGDISGCNDNAADDPYPMIRNCPVFNYASQGLGFLEERTNDRTSAVLAATQRVKAAGYHTFKAGVDLELATYNSHRYFTGGQFWTRGADLNGGMNPGRWQLRENEIIVRSLRPDEDPTADVDMDGVPDILATLEPGQILCAADRAICATAPNGIDADTNNTGLAAFIQDSWQIRPNLTLNAGLRWEQQTGYVAKNLQGTISPQGEVIPDAAYKLKNELAPRVGFIYDPTQEGKSKIFGHWGRFYEAVPMDLNVRAFGGEITHFQFVNNRRLPSTDPMYNPNCDVNFGDPRDTDLSKILAGCDQRVTQTILGEGTEFVAPGIKGQYTQELILGSEYEFLPDLKVGLNYIHRTLPTVIEDVSTDGGTNYLIANPGSDFSAEADKLRTQSDQLLAQSGCMDFTEVSDTCDRNLQGLAALQFDRARQLDSVKAYDKPVRNYDALQLTVQQRPTKRSLLQASYTYSVSKGNYPGLFSTETGQLDPNLTSLYDLPDLMANRYGPLGLDRPHNLKIDGFYQFDLKKAGVLTTGASFRAISGIAHNALAAHIFYGDEESYLLPRGAIERSPVTTQTDLHLSYGYRVNKNTTVEGFVRLFNVFNAQEELDIDEEYTTDSANPVVGGDVNDLAHVKQLDPGSAQEINTTVTPNKNFGKLNARQSPRSVQLGFRVTF
ncbi:MAG TPA: carboxypeptidase regulatory-like domain-containing protein [Kofleriaceae bacterium]|nr:carboxypeptidase regulatory-like domain-containing protein [Kofleriaceae bacterium]